MLSHLLGELLERRHLERRLLLLGSRQHGAEAARPRLGRLSAQRGGVEWAHGCRTIGGGGGGMGEEIW